VLHGGGGKRYVYITREENNVCEPELMNKHKNTSVLFRMVDKRNRKVPQ
jgi:hypothetical protein